MTPATAPIRQGAVSRFLAQYRIECVIFALAFLFYLPAINWGLPVANGPDRAWTWAFDDISPLPALTETFHVFVRDSPDHWVPYPFFHYLTLSIAYAPYLAWLALTGQWKHPSPGYPYGFSDPVAAIRNLTLIARLVSIAMASGCAVIAYRIGRLLWDRRTGLLCAATVAVPYSIFYYSKTGNVETPFLFWAALGFLTWAAIIVRGLDIRRGALLGIFAALAAATKDQASGLFLLTPILLWPYAKPQTRSEWRKSILAFIVAGAFTYALCSGLAFRPGWFRDHLHWVFIGDRSVRIYNDPYPPTLTGTLELIWRIPSEFVRWYGPLLAACALIGIGYTALRERAKLALLWPPAAYTLLFLVPLHFFKARYIIPVIFIAAIYAARGLSLAWQRLESQRFVGKAALIPAALALIFTWPVLRTADLAYQMIHDSRYEAASWLASNMPPGSSISNCGSFHTMPRLRKDTGMIILRDLHGAVEDVQTHQPEFAAVIPDWTGRPRTEYSRMCSELYSGLYSGSLGYAPVAKFRTKPLFSAEQFSEEQLLDYPSVNPYVEIFRRTQTSPPQNPSTSARNSGEPAILR